MANDFDDASFCALEFSKENLNYVKGWNGFVTPTGKFLKVAERNKTVSAHDFFVEMYTDTVLKIDLRKKYMEIQARNPECGNLSYKDMFINVLGYINYEYVGNGHTEIGVPDPTINGKKVTEQQISILTALLTMNRDNQNEIYQIFKYDRRDNSSELSGAKHSK